MSDVSLHLKKSRVWCLECPLQVFFLREEQICCDISNGCRHVSFKNSIVAIPWDDNMIRLKLFLQSKVLAIMGDVGDERFAGADLFEVVD